ncbi:guanine nucleotide-binding protein G(I)/G(S)/G(O) subunit gamma-11 [Platysternon megacephalum]|uniref:Guanine nucleotide-binding protein G(I)/G(S)/G(O) subunit gamma-11 n=1 Tax=Platysternon megacephalum TaxID=55544 RepID=A0A4D9ELZ4_9SAUR|nr:guanine nucleotide-binding protein G(I)/G(S)/G(O) subunit gamma-11 [Platysternon megacephalum]
MRPRQPGPYPQLRPVQGARRPGPGRRLPRRSPAAHAPRSPGAGEEAPPGARPCTSSAGSGRSRREPRPGAHAAPRSPSAHTPGPGGRDISFRKAKLSVPGHSWALKVPWHCLWAIYFVVIGLFSCCSQILLPRWVAITVSIYNKLLKVVWQVSGTARKRIVSSSGPRPTSKSQDAKFNVLAQLHLDN